jgi:AcrR family transcriptional regulator
MTQRMIYQTEETNQKILTLAKKLFIEQGFADTQMKNIATLAGIGRNTLYRYYRDKYDLGFAILIVILKRKTAQFFEILDQIEQHKFGTVRNGLYYLLNTYVDENNRSDDRFMAEFDAYYSGSRIPVDFLEKVKDNTSPNHMDRLIEVFKQGQVEGSIRCDLSVEHMASTFFISLPAFYSQLLLRENAMIGVNKEDLPQLPPVFMRIFLDGLKPESE